MKKQHSLAEFFKSKSFYALLCVGALAIIAITMVGLNQASSDKSKNNVVDLNESPTSDVADNEDIPDANTDNTNTNPLNTANNESSIPNEEILSNKDNMTSPIANGKDLEVDIYQNDALIVGEGENTANTTGTPVEVTEDTPAVNNEASNQPVNEPAKEVIKPETLFFDAETGLLWPITGNVIMNYSVDRVLYHPTLEQFRTNPAVIIQANVGDNVLSSAKGIVTSITEEDETGLTVKVSIGSGYTLVYGQLQDLTVEVGDTILEGDIIGSIANPSKYYVLEGSNLYFQVLKDEADMNPMLLLR